MGGGEDDEDGEDDQRLVLCSLGLVVSGLTEGQLSRGQGVVYVQKVVQDLEEREHQDKQWHEHDGEVFKPEDAAAFVPGC